MTARVLKLRQPSDASPRWTDEAVAHAVASGDPAAVAELFDRFHRPVTRYLSRVVGPGPDVDDLLQSTFLEVARGNTRYGGRSSVQTWIFGVATNVLRHHFRSTKRRRRLVEAAACEASSGATGPDPSGAVSARRALRRAAALLMTLPREQTMAFVLCELEGLRARDVAEMLDTSETAIWKRVSETRRVLRQALREGES